MSELNSTAYYSTCLVFLTVRLNHIGNTLQVFLCDFVTDILGTVDYVWNDGTVVFRTCPQEQGKVVFQIVCIKLPFFSEFLPYFKP